MSVILSASNMSKFFGERAIISEASFNVMEGDKIGILGVNGAGKTTLFKLITGELTPDEGELHISKNTVISYMSQHADFTSEKTAFEETLSVFDDLREMEREIEIIRSKIEVDPDEKLIARMENLRTQYEERGGLTYVSRARSALMGLGLSEAEVNLPMDALSGGQRTRVLLAKLLLSGSNVLLLDEPTNHLDINAVAWLEEFLRSYRGTVLVISHDRYFLDKISTRIFDVRNTSIKAYKGNYSAYVKKKQEDELAAERIYQRKKREIDKLEGIIEQQRNWGRERNFITARSKQKALERVENTLIEPDKDPSTIRFKFRAERGSGKDVLIAEDLSVAFDGQTLFSGVNLHIRKGERVFILGDNGSGKTTLLRTLIGQLKPDTGEIELGARVKIGYYDQAMSDLDPEKTPLDTLVASLPHMDTVNIRSALGAFLIRGDDVNKKIAALSGGERARVALARLMLSRCNFLIMDEPTNHLDIPSKEALEQALLDYDGTLLMVSHDRYFIEKLAHRIYYISDGGAEEYIGGYDYFLSKQPERLAPAHKPKQEEKQHDYKLKKQRDAEKRKKAAALRRLEQQIAQKEQETDALATEATEQASDYQRAIELTEKLNAAQSELDELYEQWEKLAEETDERAAE